MNLGQLTVTLGVDTRGLIAAQTAMQNWQKQTTTSLNNMSQRFRTFGYLASAAITLPIIAAGKTMFKMASDYEFAIQKIVGLTGTAQEEVNQWSEEIKRMAVEFGKTPKELAEGLYFIASSGIKGAEVLNVLELSAKAAASGLGETSTIADYLTSVLNAYRGTGITAAYATDVLVAGVREGKSEATGFASAMGAVIPMASKLGMSIDQVAGSMAAVTLTGSTAAQAATYLRGMLNILMKETKQGAVAMDEASEALGIMKTSYVDLRKILREQGIMALMERMNKLSVAYGETLVAKVFPNIRAMNEVLSLSGNNMKYNSEIIKKITNSTGSLGKAWAEVSETIKVQFDQALAAANVSMITLGKSVATAILPVLKWLVEKLEALTKWFDSLTEAQKQNKLVILAIVAALGPLSLIVSVVGYALSGLIGIVVKLTSALGLLRVVSITNPWVLIITAVTTLIALFVRAKNKTEDFVKEQEKLNIVLINVNGELKRMQELTKVDYSKMNLLGLSQAYATAWDAAAKAKKDYDKLVEARGGETKFNAWLKAGKYDIMEEAVLQRWNIAKEVIANVAKELDNFSDRASESAIATSDNIDKIILSLEKMRSVLDQLADPSQLPKAISQKEYMAALGLEQLAKAPKMPALDFQKTVMDELARQLTENAELYSIFGDAASKTSMDIQSVSDAMRTLLSTFKAGEIEMDVLIAQYNELISTQKLLGEQKRDIEALGRAFSEVGSAIEGVAGSWLSWIGSVIGKLPEIINMIKAVAAAQRASAAAAASEAIAGATASGAKMPWPVNIIAIATGVAAVIAALATIPKMAKGGTVPPGYPNDTYHALLSSGEKVLPKGLSNLSEQTQNINITVDGKVRGKDLDLVLRRFYQN